MIIEPALLGCPNCNNQYVSLRTMSSNNFGAQLWSDNVQKGPMTHGYMILLQCKQCEYYYLRKDEKYIETKKTKKELWDIYNIVFRQYPRRRLYYDKQKNKEQAEKYQIIEDCMKEYISPKEIEGFELQEPIENNVLNNISDEILIRLTYWHRRSDLERMKINMQVQFELLEPHLHNLSKIAYRDLNSELKKVDISLEINHYNSALNIIQKKKETQEFNLKNLKSLVGMIKESDPLYKLTIEINRHLKEFSKVISIIDEQYLKYDLMNEKWKSKNLPIEERMDARLYTEQFSDDYLKLQLKLAKQKNSSLILVREYNHKKV